MSGLEIKYSYDNREELKQFSTGSCDITKTEAIQCTLKIRVGYDIVDYFECLRGSRNMSDMQKTFNDVSPQYTVSSLNEFRDAVINGYITVEKLRIEMVDRAIKESDISTGDTPEKRRRWGLAQKYLRRPKPNLHIFIDRKKQKNGKWDRVYIKMDNHIPCWSGFSEVMKIDFSNLYKNDSIEIPDK